MREREIDRAREIFKLCFFSCRFLIQGSYIEIEYFYIYLNSAFDDLRISIIILFCILGKYENSNMPYIKKMFNFFLTSSSYLESGFSILKNC